MQQLKEEDGLTNNETNNEKNDLNDASKIENNENIRRKKTHFDIEEFKVKGKVEVNRIKTFN